MHIAEGFLPGPWWYLWFLFTIPVVAYGLAKIRRTIEEDPSKKTLLAMAGAFIFVLSSLKLPSVAGSSSHPTGTGLSAILFGPSVTAVLSSIVLIYQALLLAHGGLTTLGANTASMGIIGPLVGWLTWKAAEKTPLGTDLSVFLAAAAADLSTYVVTSLQLALAFPAKTGGVLASFKAFMAVFALTQVPLALAEGLLTLYVMRTLFKLGTGLPEHLKHLQRSAAAGEAL